MPYNFDKIIDRKQTNCVKHDAVSKFFGAENLLPLWVADMDFETPDFIQKAMQKRLDHPVNGYTYFSDEFYASFINWMEKRHQFVVEQSWLEVTPGVLTGLSLAIMGFTKPGDKIIIQPPVYQPFFQLVESSDRVVVENDLLFEDGQYKMDFDGLEASIDSQTKMIIISNPHNPVGRVWTKEELTHLVSICEKHNIIILADEIHSDIIFRPSIYTPIASINEYAKNNSLSFIAPSKTFNIAGLATALVIIPNEDKHKEFIALTSRFHVSGASVFGSVACEAAYTYGEEWLEQLLVYLKSNVELVKSYFSEHLPSVRVIETEGTYLLWLDFSRLELADKKLHEILTKDAKVALNKGISFGAKGENFMRLNIGSPQAIIIEGLERIVTAFKR